MAPDRRVNSLPEGSFQRIKKPTIGEQTQIATEALRGKLERLRTLSETPPSEPLDLDLRLQLLLSSGLSPRRRLTELHFFADVCQEFIQELEKTDPLNLEPPAL